MNISLCLDWIKRKKAQTGDAFFSLKGKGHQTDPCIEQTRIFCGHQLARIIHFRQIDHFLLPSNKNKKLSNEAKKIPNFPSDTFHIRHFLHQTTFARDAFHSKHTFTPKTSAQKHILHQTNFAPDTFYDKHIHTSHTRHLLQQARFLYQMFYVKHFSHQKAFRLDGFFQMRRQFLLLNMSTCSMY